MLLKECVDELVKKVNSIDSKKQKLEKKIEDVYGKIRDTSKFVEIHAFNRLTKIEFNTRMEEASKDLATKT